LGPIRPALLMRRNTAPAVMQASVIHTRMASATQSGTRYELRPGKPGAREWCLR
jgi:hypothetical protein